VGISGGSVRQRQQTELTIEVLVAQRSCHLFPVKSFRFGDQLLNAGAVAKRRRKLTDTITYFIASAPLRPSQHCPTGGHGTTGQTRPTQVFKRNSALLHLRNLEGGHLAYPSCHSLLAWDDETKGTLFAVEGMTVGLIGQEDDSVGESRIQLG